MATEIMDSTVCNQYLITHTVFVGTIGTAPMKITSQIFYPTRKLVILKNVGRIAVAVSSKEHGLTADTGYRLQPGDELRLPIGMEIELFGIALDQMTGSVISVMELG